MVRGLRFEGNHAIDDYTLSTAIATSNSSWMATAWWVRWLGLGEKKYLDEIEFRRDVVRLLLLYRQSGFMRARIDTLVRRTDKGADITFRITEGPPVRLTQMTITGVGGILDTAVLRKSLPLQVGAPFNRFLFQASADTIVARLQNHGHPAAEVLRNFDSNADSLTATAQLDAEAGAFARIGSVLVRGLVRIDTTTVLRAVPLRPRGQFMLDQLYESQRDLYSLGLFSSVSVSLADSVMPGDSVVNPLIQVVEGPRHRVRAGIGYGTVDCFRAQAGWSALNFLGGGRTLDLTGSLSKLGVGSPTDIGLGKNVCSHLDHATDPTADTVNYSLGATLVQPAFLSERHTASIGVVAERRSEYLVYVRQDVGANGVVVFNANRQMPLSLGYGFSVGNTVANPVVYCVFFKVCSEADRKFLAQSRRFAAITATAVRNRVNSVIDPTTGSEFNLGLVYASRLVGSDSLYEFNRGELNYAQYYSLDRSTVFAWRVRGGAIIPPRITLAGQSALFVPPDQRFYAGGPNSVRGYAQNALGPRVYVEPIVVGKNNDTTFSAPQPAPTGGTAVFVLNAELRFATPVLPSRMRVALFVDVGQVWERGEALGSTHGLRVTPGAGLRFVTPLGPVRLDAAYNGYASDPGALYYQNSTTIQLISPSYQPPQPSSFWKRLEFQFAVGQAF